MSTSPEFPTAVPTRNAAAINRFEETDREFLQLARCHDARELQFPTLISKILLEQAEYPQAFPHLLMIACACHDPTQEPLFVPENLALQEWYLSPAVCYHAYALYHRQVLVDPQIVTARGRCYRREDSFQFGRRQLEFEMREIVLLGDPEWLKHKIAQLQTQIDRIAGAHSLSVHWETAEDPFFLPTAKGKALMQRLMETKKELVCEKAEPLAIASINRHGSFFGERFAIRQPDETPVHSACVAFGLDRWAALRNPNAL
jgi:seryl-tRNA synthetase